MRGESLDDYFTLHFSSSGTASYLSKQLERSFSSPEVGCMEREVSIQDACEGDIWKIQSLCDHLGTHQDLDFAAGKPIQRLVEVI